MHELITKSIAKLDPLTFLAVVVGGVLGLVYILNYHNKDIDSMLYNDETTTYMWMCNSIEQGNAGQHIKNQLQVKLNTIRMLEGRLDIKTPMGPCSE